jgi:hypothetical protein
MPLVGADRIERPDAHNANDGAENIGLFKLDRAAAEWIYQIRQN